MRCEPRQADGPGGRGRLLPRLAAPRASDGRRSALSGRQAPLRGALPLRPCCTAHLQRSSCGSHASSSLGAGLRNARAASAGHTSGRGCHRRYERGAAASLPQWICLCSAGASGHSTPTGPSPLHNACLIISSAGKTAAVHAANLRARRLAPRDLPRLGSHGGACHRGESTAWSAQHGGERAVEHTCNG